MVVEPCVAHEVAMQSAIQSTCCSIDTIMFDSTDGLPGPVIMNRFGKPDDRQTEVGDGPVRPLSRSVRPSRPVMSTLTMRAGHRVEAGGEHDRVELQRLVGQVDAGRGDGLDRLPAKIDEAHVGSVERLVVAGVDAQPLRADGIRRRAQRLGRLRVVDDAADLVAHELGEQFVGRSVAEMVCVRAEDLHDPTVLPRLVVRGAALLVGDGRGADRRCGSGTPACDHFAASRYSPRFVRNRSSLASGIGAVVGGHREVGRALEDGELRGLSGDDRDGLDRRRAGADDGDALAREVDALVRPAAGEVHVARERVGAGDVDLLRHRQAAGRHDVEPAAELLALRGAHAPPLLGVVPHRLFDAAVERRCRGAGRADRRRVAAYRRISGCGGVLLASTATSRRARGRSEYE